MSGQTIRRVFPTIASHFTIFSHSTMDEIMLSRLSSIILKELNARTMSFSSWKSLASPFFEQLLVFHWSSA